MAEKNGAEKEKHSWDMGLDFRKVSLQLQRRLRRAEKKSEAGKLLVLLLQLYNGSRVGEASVFAVEWARHFLKTGDPVYRGRVRVEKRRDEAERLMAYPVKLRVPEDRLRAAAEYLVDADPARLKVRVKVYAVKVLGINTHSLRYAFITHMLEQGVSPALIAKITGHAKLDYILHYTQKKKAEEILLEELGL